ncbi:aspartyl/asparaginyl beta-hydroxylase domain-containing protein [Parvularcula oceani]|uniref:aspartyl/asparaginyl beta-hydroxylase domain-containing protein n=1 Tax=Parvularcula oceani TaxID=1247963 RepID=UPI0004E12D84|nr:aspartyl/asparaginyl beta-hydroxylase domain-containing protein [Parvularcula oceani]
MKIWQAPTALANLTLLCPLELDVDADAMAGEARAAIAEWGHSQQEGPHHDGTWTRLGLYAPSGDPFRSYKRGGERREKTAVLKGMPVAERFLDRFEGTLRTASLSRMEAGAGVGWHRDRRQSIDLEYVRLHIPLVTSPRAVTTIGHQTRSLTKGAVWYGDFACPHTVRNAAESARIHLMFDVKATEDLWRLFPQSFRRQTSRRAAARRAANAIFDRMERRSPEGRKALAYKRARARAVREGRPLPPPPWAG